MDFDNLPAYTPPLPEAQSHRATWSDSGIKSLPADWIEKAREQHPSLTKEQALQTFNSLDDYFTNNRPSERCNDWFKKFKNWVGRDITPKALKSSPSGFAGQGGGNGGAYSQSVTERQTETPEPSKHVEKFTAFAGLELIMFNDLVKKHPTLTQKAVREIAGLKGKDVFVVLQEMTEKAKAGAA